MAVGGAGASHGAGGIPVLWQIELSHYNEKVRWALDHKRVAHRRRSLLPGAHILVARRLTGGACETTPVLTLDGVSIGESDEIVLALERRFPEPALLPADPAARARALELAAVFDEAIGEHLRRVVYLDLLGRPELVRPLFTRGQPPAARALFTLAFPVLRVGMRRAMEIEPAAAQHSRTRLRAAVDRLESELDAGGGDYLAGDRFTFADLTAASLLYPLAGSAHFPYPAPELPPGPALELLSELAERPGGRWVAEMYARHRAPG